jgi:hypothetical protein
MKAGGALQSFFFLVGLKRGKALLAPRRLVLILRSAVFTYKISIHSYWMPRTGLGFLF